ncbi:MAG: hypothetical protein JWO76_1343 [Nocardioides sp.]|nr:hypothetical protein [Nocardioides sp.]
MQSAMTDVTAARRAIVRDWCLLAAVLSMLAFGLAGCGMQAEREGRSDRGSAAKATSDKPVVRHRTVRQRQQIPFSSLTRNSAALKKGVSQVSQRGAAGLRVRFFRVTMKDGVVAGRKLVRTLVVRRPVPRITLRGTRVDPPAQPPAPALSARCDSNYAGACVPIASDVDCGGGSGNGPAYVYSSVRIVGSDVYDLDADGDGYGCD